MELKRNRERKKEQYQQRKKEQCQQRKICLEIGKEISIKV